MSGFGDFWKNLGTVLPTLNPSTLGQVGGFFHQGSNDQVVKLLQQLHDDPTSAASVKTALITAGASDKVRNWVDAAAVAAANKDVNGFNQAMSNAKDAALESNGTFSNISNVINPWVQNRGAGGTVGGWHPHPHFRR